MENVSKTPHLHEEASAVLIPCRTLQSVCLGLKESLSEGSSFPPALVLLRSIASRCEGNSQLVLNLDMMELEEPC